MLGSTLLSKRTRLIAFDLLARLVQQVIVVQHGLVEPVFTRHLRNHLVTAALEAEAVDIIVTQQRRQVTAYVGHVDAEVARTVAVYDKGGLRPGKFNRLAEKHKLATGHGRADQLSGDLVKALVASIAGNDKLQR